MPPARALQAALHFLGQPCPAGLDLASTWNWALENWDLARVPRLRQKPFEAGTAAVG
jgi:hypothetical protein